MKRFLLVSCFVLSCPMSESVVAGTIFERKAKDTLSAVEIDHGDALHFTLANGRTRTLVLEDTWDIRPQPPS